KDVADALLEGDTTTMGKYPYWKILRNIDGKKVQLGMMSAERSMFSLTPDGAEILVKLGKNIVEIMDFELKGSLFAVGVVKADHNIRIGDDIVAVCNGVIKGVGVAVMCGEEMEQMKRGIAAKMRHYH
ncbi:MAG: queuine tRNA-ribosyltransferase containing PUA domain protein, partial [archaeon]|nr:queuine tRNA-ribosyltransferase containing PUA domain protein [archaeon]